MADSEERQKFEVASETPDAFEQAWEKYNASGNAGGWEKVAFVKGFGAAWRAAWRAAYEAGAIAMREKAAELRESLKLICAEAESWHTMHDHDGNGLVQCDSICALIPRMKAAISGAEESKKENE